MSTEGNTQPNAQPDTQPDDRPGTGDAGAASAVREAIRSIVPDADLDTLPGDAPLREAFELDSLDFLMFVERLSASTGCPITEADYPELRTLDSSVAFLRRGG